MGEKTVQSITVLPFALMMGVISAIMGLIIGIIYAFVFGAVISGVPLPTDAAGVINFSWLSVLFGVGSIIIMPVLGFVSGLIWGAVVAFIYNFLAPRIGGIRIRFKEASNVPPQS